MPQVLFNTRVDNVAAYDDVGAVLTGSVVMAAKLCQTEQN